MHEFTHTHTHTHTKAMQELQGAVDTARASLAAKETHTALLQTDVAVLHSELQELRVTLADEVAAARLAALAHKTKGKQKQDRANEEDTQKDETGVSLAVGVCGGYSGTDYSSADRVKASMAFVIESMQGAVMSLPVFLPRSRSVSRARAHTHTRTHTPGAVVSVGKNIQDGPKSAGTAGNTEPAAVYACNERGTITEAIVNTGTDTAAV